MRTTMRLVAVWAMIILIPQGALHASAAERTEMYAFIVAVSYDGDNRLEYAYNDGTELESTLMKSVGFPATNIRFFHDRQSEFSASYPTKDNILNGLDALLVKAPKNAILIFQFSGHGSYRSEYGKDKLPTSFLIPLKANDDPDSWIALEQDIYKRVGQCRADAKVMILDACRSQPGESMEIVIPDGVARSLQLAKARSSPDKAPAAAKKSGFVLPSVGPDKTATFSSCGRGQQSMESHKYRHGVFMKHLLEGLSGPADGYEPGKKKQPEDDQLTALELFNYARDRTREEMRTDPKDEETIFQDPVAIFAPGATGMTIGSNIGVTYSQGNGKITNLVNDPRFKSNTETSKLFLRHANFRWCDLSGIDFRGRDINLTGADFSHAILVGTRFSGCDMTKVRLDYANCTNANFYETKLGGAFAKEVTFDGATFFHTNRYMRGMTVNGGSFLRINGHRPGNQ